MFSFLTPPVRFHPSICLRWNINGGGGGGTLRQATKKVKIKPTVEEKISRSTGRPDWRKEQEDQRRCEKDETGGNQLDEGGRRGRRREEEEGEKQWTSGRLRSRINEN